MNRKQEFVLPVGQKRPRALQLLILALQQCREDRPWKITVEWLRNERSTAQNAYLWAVPNKMISEHTGFEAEEVHEYLCGRFWGWRDRKVPKTPRNPEGLESIPVRSTTRDESGKRCVLTTIEFQEYVDFIQRFAAIKLGLVIPDPDPLYDLHREAA